LQFTSSWFLNKFVNKELYFSMQLYRIKRIMNSIELSYCRINGKRSKRNKKSPQIEGLKLSTVFKTLYSLLSKIKAMNK